MDPKKRNKIREIVRLQQILKKWRKHATAPKQNTITKSTSKGMKFLKRTLSISDSSFLSAASADIVPKGFFAVCVGEELKRFVIPTEYLSHRAFGILLSRAEEEFGFKQEGVLRIPCEVSTFQRILKAVQEKKEVMFMHELGAFNGEKDMVGCCSSAAEISQSHHLHKQMCR
ncbi:auxin-responsive protein SAUR19-like [Magnolia sinica]|uniref:auxin-responsive protein SAUR19-like n=1 Tax=Magnolia sinica TaxID=86752 RepID=UPI00265A2219|nr:auxin-responsive protein SAUR19-like [Magnolia sinica]